MTHSRACECCILGAGPAGLGTALELVKHGVRDIVIVDRNEIVGGLARTEVFDGVRFDVGPHRFFTKNQEINRLWHETLGADFRPVNRLTRIYYRNKFFNYPIKPFDTLAKLGFRESLEAIVSFAATQFSGKPQPKTFEDWITQKFGRKLYETFFKTYTEKVWGIPCSQIGAEWAAQRIKGLDIIQVIRNSLSLGKRDSIKTLVDQFDYPILGAGQMYHVMAENVVAKGAQIILGARVRRIHRRGNEITSIAVMNGDGSMTEICAKQYFSSIPLTQFFQMIEPPPSGEVQEAVSALYYREHITVNLLVAKDHLFPDQWIYVHSPDVMMARLANYNNFSRAMVQFKPKSALSVEYFVFQHEDLWKKPDDELKGLAVDELVRLGLLERNLVESAWVVRETESYPTYFMGFAEPYSQLKRELNRLENLYPIGRGGMYKYNNQDHSTMAGILAARNYLKLPGAPYNLWDINVDAEYHEGATRAAAPGVRGRPERGESKIPPKGDQEPAGAPSVG
jgi:protoporphyrinogen oxidase